MRLPWSVVTRGPRTTGAIAQFVANPARAVMIGFALVIALGTLALMTPLASTGGSGTRFLTALFTATSATCVTGLTVVPTGHWTVAGETAILVMIQVGGLGVMTLASLLVLLIGRRLGMRASMLAAAESRTLAVEDVRRVVLGIVVIAATIESVVAAILTARFWLHYGEPFGQALYSGVFHSISAFNNAGFALEDNSLIDYASDVWICVPVMVAVVVGGLGFPVLWELRRHWRRPRDWSLHTAMTIWVSGILLLLGSVLVTLVEWNNPRTLGALHPAARVLAGSFHAVSARTAGFNTVDIGSMRPEGLLTLDGLMFVGGGSAGTAGGIKVTTFALLGFVMWAELRGEPTVHVVRRRLPSDVQRQALTVALLAVGVVAGGTMALLAVTTHTLDEALFETISAFGTVGLSTGMTPDVPPIGQVVIILLMYFGRLGPITLGAGLALRNRARRYDFPEERALVG